MRPVVPMILLSLVAAPVAEAAKKKPGKGPTPKIVRTHISEVTDAVHTESWMTEDQVVVAVDKIKIGKAVKRKAGTGHYDPKIWQWPVKARVRITECRTPETCETTEEGSYVPDMWGGRTVFWFDREGGFSGWRWTAGSTA